MARAKTTKKKTATTRKSSGDDGTLMAAIGILFAGTAVSLVGTLQTRDNIKLLLVGFGAALLVMAGVMLGMVTRPSKRR